MNRTTEKTNIKATSENTVLITVAAYEDYESRTIALRQSAADYGVPIMIIDTKETWRSFYHNKIERMHGHLTQFRDAGNQFAFVLDSRDVVFIEPFDVILAKFNAIHDGRVIFNQDVFCKIWPSHYAPLAHAIEKAMGSQYARLNAGLYAGAIENILSIQQLAMEIRRELKEGCPRPGMAQTIYQDMGARFSDDDQHLYQICLTYRPEWFKIDNDKELFAVLNSYPKDLRKCSDAQRQHDVLNHAAIIHSPWMGSGKEWRDWVFQNRWER